VRPARPRRSGSGRRLRHGSAGVVRHAVIPPLAVRALADEIATAYTKRELLRATPSSRDPAFDLSDAYAVETVLTRQRRAKGWTTVGRKVGYANKAVWRALKLETLVWASMYDRTVQYSSGGRASLSIGRMISPKIEPEVVFKLKKPIGAVEPADVLDAVEWLAIGFEIIDCIFPDWKFQPTDFVAAFGLHAALIVGEPLAVRPEMILPLVERLPQLEVRLSKDGELIDKGSGRNALRSPALCLGELAAAIGRQKGAEPLAAGELVSTGTLTASQPATAGDSWTVEVYGLDLKSLTLEVV
jgi:2-oxo-3-hexenedioate decarboxylase